MNREFEINLYSDEAYTHITVSITNVDSGAEFYVKIYQVQAKSAYSNYKQSANEYAASLGKFLNCDVNLLR